MTDNSTLTMDSSESNISGGVVNVLQQHQFTICMFFSFSFWNLEKSHFDF